jgi:hypothetical protein
VLNCQDRAKAEVYLSTCIPAPRLRTWLWQEEPDLPGRVWLSNNWSKNEESALCICGFCIHGLNQPQMGKIRAPVLNIIDLFS